MRHKNSDTEGMRMADLMLPPISSTTPQRYEIIDPPETNPNSDTHPKPAGPLARVRSAPSA